MKKGKSASILLPSCLVGRISIDGSPLGRLNSGALETGDRICGGPERPVDIYRLGDPDHLSVFEDAGRWCILLGVIHNPPFLRNLPKSGSSDAARLFGTTPLAQVEGEFVSVTAGFESEQAQSVQIATDKFGFRTAFYCERDGVLYFATHISGLRVFPLGALDELSTDSLRHYYHFGVTPGTATLIEGVRKVGAGSKLAIGSGSVSSERYFDVLDICRPGITSGKTTNEVAGDVNDAMAASIEARTSGTEKVGLALSGGVDSGFVALHLKEKAPNFHSFNLAYGEFYDEHDRVAKLERELGLNVTRMNLAVDDLLETFDNANARASEPVLWNDTALAVLAGRAYESGVGILFDGDGADRLFLGMNSHVTYDRLLRWYDSLSRFGLAGAAVWASSLLPGENWKKLRVHFTNWRNGIPPYTGRKFDGAGDYDENRERSIFELGIAHLWNDFTARTESREPAFFFSYLAIRMCPERFFRTPLEQQSFIGLRPVSPYWDERLVGLAISIPTDLKVQGSTTKFILREAAARAGSREYWNLPKVGLQSAFEFAARSPQGQRWVDRCRAEVLASEPYARLKEAEGGREIDPDRLMAVWTWYKAWKSG